MNIAFRYFLAGLIFIGANLFSQNENSKWYFGNNAGLDLMTSPPSALTNGSVNSTEGCASVAHPGTGSLLFYTDGSTIWDQTHSVMANGAGLNSSFSSAQSSLILKQPGSTNLYYVFTQEGQNVFNGGLYYSIVDMSLASGNGSVVTKNTSLFQPSCEKVTATRHCNGIDFWIISHDYGSTVFRCHLLTATGISTAVVTSSVGASASNVNLSLGVLKVSPNGKMIGQSFQGNLTTGLFELYDFDNSTGIVSNAFTLNTTLFSCYCCEFSQDGTKFYGTVSGSNVGLYQWDLCAGSSSAVVNSQTAISTGTPTTWFIQLADDGKIYASRAGQTSLGVINNPNSSGSACNYSTSGASISPKTALLGLPNFVLSQIKPAVLPFTYTVSQQFGCQTTSFNASPAIQTYTTIGCISSGYSVTSYVWNFGDPGSGSSNISTLANPSHSFSTLGIYTTQLIINYSCGRGADTLNQIVNISQACTTITSSSISCSGLGSATISNVGAGPFSYTWIPSAQTSSVANNLSPGTYTILVHNGATSSTSSVVTTFTSPVPFTGTLSTNGSVTCQGINTGTASFINFNGGSSNQNFLWSNGIITYTSATVNSLSSGQWSVIVTDALTGCKINQTFTITQPFNFTLNLSSTTPSVCLGGSITLTGTNSGGTPGYTYTWTNGPASNIWSVNESIAGTHVYTLHSSDVNNCLTSNTIALNFYNNPSLTVSNVSICPLSTGILTVTGATSYTWASTTLSLTGNSFSDSPLVNTQYTVVGSAFSCISQATAGIIIKSSPSPFIISNGPKCDGDILSINAYGGVSFLWSGPGNFVSSFQTQTINPVGLNNAGVYNVTVTAINGCTASTSETVNIYAKPTLTAIGSTVCAGETLNLFVNTNGNSFLWHGPSNFTSTVQNPAITNATLPNMGTYTIHVSSVQGCTNSSQTSASIVAPPSLMISLSSNSLCEQAFNGSPNSITLTSTGANTYTLQTPYVQVSNPNGPVSSITGHPPFNGVGTATLYGSNGICTMSATAVFSVIPNPTITISSPTPVICAGENFTYTSFGAQSYTWGPNSPGITTYSMGSIAVINPSVNSVFSVYGGSLGCNSAIKTTSITVNPIPQFSIAAQKSAICLHDETVLTANDGASSYIWSPAYGLSSIIGSSVAASPLTQQTYTVTGSLNSCTNTAMVTVSILSLPNPTATILKPEICLNEIVTLQGYGGEHYSWQTPAGDLLSGQSASFVAFNRIFEGTFTLTASDKNNCKNSAVTTLTIYPLPEGYLSGSVMKACIPFTSEFNYEPALNPGIETNWYLDGNHWNAKSFSFSFLTAGIYTITGNYRDSLTNCINVQTYTVEAWPNPVAGFSITPEKPVENLDEVSFLNTSSGEQLSKWDWHFINNRGYRSDSKNTNYLFSDAGLYPVSMIVSNSWGCKDTIIKTIKIETDLSLYVPNVFTPNDDGLNDVFLPVVRSVKSYHLSIFDRWGALIFQTNDTMTGWDGTYKNEVCKLDVYAWKIEFSANNGDMKILTGDVLLSR